MTSPSQLPSPIPFAIDDDKDLDDAALWAVIDSAAALSSKSRTPLAIKQLTNNNSLSPPPSQFKRNFNSRTTPMAMVKRGPCTPTTPSVYTSSPDVEVTSHHSFSGIVPSVSLFKDCQNAAMAILEKTDYVMISGNPFIKKSGWRKIAFYFNISFEIKDRSIEFDENKNVRRAEFVVRAYMQGGRFSDGWGSCDSREKRFMKPNHDIPSTAETRAKNRACQDLLGIGEYRPGASHSHQ